MLSSTKWSLGAELAEIYKFPEEGLALWSDIERNRKDKFSFRDAPIVGRLAYASWGTSSLPPALDKRPRGIVGMMRRVSGRGGCRPRVLTNSASASRFARGCK